MQHARRHHGFTLLDLVLVLAVMALLLAAVAPNLAGFHRGGRLREAGERFASVTQLARSQASVTATLHRLEIEADGTAYRLTRQSQQSFVAADGEFGAAVTLPPDLRLQVVTPDGRTLPQIDFHPTGRHTPAMVTFTAAWGEAIRLTGRGATEPFRIEEATP